MKKVCLDPIPPTEGGGKKKDFHIAEEAEVISLALQISVHHLIQLLNNEVTRLGLNNSFHADRGAGLGVAPPSPKTNNPNNEHSL